MTTQIDSRLIKSPKPTLQEEVEVIAASLGYRLVNMSTAFTGHYMWRLFRDGLFTPSSLYGGGLNLIDVRTFLEAERYARRFDIEVPSAVEKVHSHALGEHRAVVKNITECGYAIACQLDAVLDEPDWFYRDDDDRIFADLDAARERMRMALDSDRAANFELSRGGLI
jgi:hypothetical protein